MQPRGGVMNKVLKTILVFLIIKLAIVGLIIGIGTIKKNNSKKD